MAVAASRSGLRHLQAPEPLQCACQSCQIACHACRTKLLVRMLWLLPAAAAIV
jgi:hypothetical protein